MKLLLGAILSAKAQTYSEIGSADKNPYTFCTACTDRWETSYNAMERNDIRDEENVNQNTHPFLETYRNWVCESHNPDFVMGENRFDFPQFTRCCQPGDEETDSLCTESAHNKCSGSWADWGALSYVMCN